MTLLDTFHHRDPAPMGFSSELLRELPCGLIACPLPDAATHLPELSALYESVPVACPEQWVIDVKIHMLMPGQYPCIPNWHCDFVPRDASGATRFDVTDNSPLMLLWVSGGPLTEYLATPFETSEHLTGHDDVARAMRGQPTARVNPQRWYQFSQHAPHRGVVATEHCWRVFARVTHSALNPPRPTVSPVRRHAQVYLDASNFVW